MIEWTETEKAYWSGMCDGEMALQCGLSKHNNYNVRVSLCTTDYTLIQMLSTHYSVSLFKKIRYNPRQRQAYGTHLYSKNCIDFISNIYPYLMLKHLQAKTILDFKNKLITGLEAYEICARANKTGPEHFRLIQSNFVPILWKPEACAYYAGLTDAEGCFTYHSAHLVPKFCLKIREQDVLLPLSRVLNCNINIAYKGNRTHAALHRVNLDGKKLRSFTENIYPYLKLKKPQANIVLNFGTTKEEREASVRELRRLNKTGCDLDGA